LDLQRQVGHGGVLDLKRAGRRRRCWGCSGFGAANAMRVAFPAKTSRIGCAISASTSAAQTCPASYAFVHAAFVFFHLSDQELGDEMKGAAADFRLN
jgi:hypothetical protein